MIEQITARIEQLKAERDHYMMIAPVQAQERIAALQATIDAEIRATLTAYDNRIADLETLIAPPPGDPPNG